MIHQAKREESKKMQEQFDLDNEEYKTYMRSKKKDAPKMEKPQEPQSKLLFIPADCSQAMMIQLLNENDGQASSVRPKPMQWGMLRNKTGAVTPM